MLLFIPVADFNLFGNLLIPLQQLLVNVFQLLRPYITGKNWTEMSNLPPHLCAYTGVGDHGDEVWVFLLLSD